MVTLCEGGCWRTMRPLAESVAGAWVPLTCSWMLIACLLVVPLVACSQSRKPANHTAPVVTAAPTPAPDSELRLPPPSLLYRLYETTAAVLDATWSNKDTDSRQVNFPNGNVVITLSTFIAMMLATVFGVVGFGSVGLLAAKALAVGTLALFLTALSSLKHKGGHKSDSGGQTVHFVPIQTGGGGHHHEYFHDRGDFLPPYLAYADDKA